MIQSPKPLQNTRKWKRSSEAQVGNRSEDAACSMAEDHGRTNQDAGARRSLLSQTQLPRVSKNIYLRHSAVLAPRSALKQRSLSRTGGWGPGHGNVYVRWSSPPRPPSRVMHDQPPAQRSSFPKVDVSSAGQEEKENPRRRREAPQLCLACSSDVWQQRRSRERGVPVLGLNYIASTGQVDGAARRVPVSTSPPSSAMTGREGGRWRGARSCILSRRRCADFY